MPRRCRCHRIASTSRIHIRSSIGLRDLRSVGVRLIRSSNNGQRNPAKSSSSSSSSRNSLTKDHNSRCKKLLPPAPIDRKSRTSNGTRESFEVQRSAGVSAEGATVEEEETAAARTYRRPRRAIRSSARGSSGRPPLRPIGTARSRSMGLSLQSLVLVRVAVILALRLLASKCRWHRNHLRHPVLLR